MNTSDSRTSDLGNETGNDSPQFPIKFIPSFWMTNVLQGRGFVRLGREQFELNGRRYWKGRYIALLVLGFAVVGALPGLLFIYLICRKRVTVGFLYSDVLKFSRRGNICAMTLTFDDNRVRGVEFSMEYANLDRLETLVKQNGAQTTRP